MSRLAIKFRLYPTPAQETTLHGMLAVCRAVYNSLVLWRKHDYEGQGKAPGYCQQANALPLWKQAHPELRTLYFQVLQDVCKRVDRAFDAFFRRVQAGEKPGYPRFKGEGQYDSLTYPQATAFAVQEDCIRLSKVGDVKVVVHRSLPGKPKTCTLRLQAGKWYACVVCEVETEPLPESAEAYKVVSRIHERIRHRRHDFVHQLARKLVNRYGLIAVEDLRVANLVRRPAPKPDPDKEGQYLPNGATAKAGLNKSIADAAWSLFRHCLTYKAANAGREVVNVAAAYTSQDCSQCGQRVPKTLGERVHVCPCCGLVLDRDVNAARNILHIAVGQHSVPAQTGEKPRPSGLGSCHYWRKNLAHVATEQISIGDWEATPPTVQNVLLSLERERNAFREQLDQLKHAQDAASEEYKHRLQRYQTLVEQQFLMGLTPEQQQEIERLGEYIDAVNSAFYPSLSSLAETIAAHTGKQPE